MLIMKKLLSILLSFTLCFCCFANRVWASDDQKQPKPTGDEDYAVLILDESIYPHLTYNGCTIIPTVSIQGNYTLDGTNYTGVNATATQTSVSFSFSDGNSHITSCSLNNYSFYIRNNHVVVQLSFNLNIDFHSTTQYLQWILV